MLGGGKGLTIKNHFETKIDRMQYNFQIGFKDLKDKLWVEVKENEHKIANMKT